MIYERLSANNDPHLTATVLEHLEVFASDGLRTLCLAAAEVSASFRLRECYHRSSCILSSTQTNEIK